MTGAVRDCIAAADDRSVSDSRFIQMQGSLSKEELYQFIEAVHGVPSPHRRTDSPCTPPEDS